jgi:hypothetical protein
VFINGDLLQGWACIDPRPTHAMPKPCELALPHGGGMSVVNFATTAASNRWVPKEYFDTSWTLAPLQPPAARLGSGRGDVGLVGRVGDKCVVKPIIRRGFVGGILTVGSSRDTMYSRCWLYPHHTQSLYTKRKRHNNQTSCHGRVLLSITRD